MENNNEGSKGGPTYGIIKFIGQGINDTILAEGGANSSLNKKDVPQYVQNSPHFPPGLTGNRKMESIGYGKRKYKKIPGCP